MLPIACEKQNYTKRGTVNRLSAAAKELFKKINYDTVNLAIADCLHRMNPASYSEKSPTAYIFRRNYATTLFLLGCSESECEALMGHKIEDPYSSRSFFTTPDKLWEISEKLRAFPLFNTIGDTNTITMDSGTAHFSMAPMKQYDIPLSEGQFSIRLTTSEPCSDLTLCVINSGPPLEGNLRTYPEEIPKSRICNIRKDFFDTYSEKQDTGKTQIQKEQEHENRFRKPPA